MNINLRVIKKIVLFSFVFITCMLHGQVNLSKEEIRLKTDSILAEGNLLYRYERVAWVSTDHAKERKDIKKKFGGYLIYQSGDSIKSIIMEKGKSNCIYEMTYVTDFTTPYQEKSVNRGLSTLEIKLMNMRTKLLKEIFTPAYNVTNSEGYNLNVELIPFETGYKLYIITGTSKSDIIPMGNDYIFVADINGNITSWRKFHSRLIPAITKINGGKVREITHSHLRIEPFISATDICTFKLYGSIYGLDEFKVYSPALSKYFTYNAVKNTIVTDDK